MSALIHTPTTDEHEYIRPGQQLDEFGKPIQKKGFGHHTFFEVGTCYLAGVTGGGTVGFTLGVHKALTAQKDFTTLIKANQIINSTGKWGSSTANSFGVFALTYSLSRDLMKHWFLPKFSYFQSRYGAEPVDHPLADAIGATIAGTMQGFSRFGARSIKPPVIGGLAIGGVTYLSMTYGMDTIKKLPFNKL